MFKYYNCNPKGRIVDDCTVRAISLAENKTWYETYDTLSLVAKEAGTILDDVTLIDSYLNSKYESICFKCNGDRITIKEFVQNNNIGTYLITMQNHITCVINGTIYDTWDCSNKRIWSVWKVLGANN